MSCSAICDSAASLRTVVEEEDEDDDEDDDDDGDESLEILLETKSTTSLFSMTSQSPSQASTRN